jgi:hypothetical protein
MLIRLETIPIEVTLSVERLVSRPDGTHEMVCRIRFAGFNKHGVGGDSSTIRAGKRAVIGEIVMTGGSLGIRRSSLPHLPQRGTASKVSSTIVSSTFDHLSCDSS